MKEMYLIKVKQITDVYKSPDEMYQIRLKSIKGKILIKFDFLSDDNYVEQATDYLISLGMKPIAIVHKSNDKCTVVVENLNHLQELNNGKARKVID
jgi:hypothetical protein